MVESARSSIFGTPGGRHRRQLVFSERILGSAPLRAAVTVFAVVVAGSDDADAAGLGRRDDAPRRGVGLVPGHLRGRHVGRRPGGRPGRRGCCRRRCHPAAADARRVLARGHRVVRRRLAARAAVGDQRQPRPRARRRGHARRPVVRRPVGAAEDRLGHGSRRRHARRLRCRRGPRHRRRRLARRPRRPAGRRLLGRSTVATRSPTRTVTAPRWPASSRPTRTTASASRASATRGVKVMPVTVLGADGTGQDSDVIAGVVWAADHGADVILMSFSNPGYSPALQAALDYAWSAGAVLVAATGNDGVVDGDLPGRLDRGRRRLGDQRVGRRCASSSNYGADTFLAAPGVGHRHRRRRWRHHLGHRYVGLRSRRRRCRRCAGGG